MLSMNALFSIFVGHLLVVCLKPISRLITKKLHLLKIDKIALRHARSDEESDKERNNEINFHIAIRI